MGFFVHGIGVATPPRSLTQEEACEMAQRYGPGDAEQVRQLRALYRLAGVAGAVALPLGCLVGALLALLALLAITRRHQDLVLLLLDERSYPPPTLEGKLMLAVDLRDRAVAAGLAPELLIFDPVLPNLSWPDAYAQAGAVIKTVRWLAAGTVFGEPVRTMAGLSNLRSGFRRLYPQSLEAQVLALLAGAGLTLARPMPCRPRCRKALR